MVRPPFQFCSTASFVLLEVGDSDFDELPMERPSCYPCVAHSVNSGTSSFLLLEARDSDFDELPMERQSCYPFVADYGIRNGNNGATTLVCEHEVFFVFDFVGWRGFRKRPFPNVLPVA